jgi:hypothetical protein
LITDLFLGVFGAFVGGLWFMLGVGVIHAQWLHQLPTVSYWTSFLIVWLFTGIFTPAASARAAVKVNTEL